MAKEQGSAKRSGRMCTSLVGKCRGEAGRAKFFEAREKLIKVQAKEPYKYLNHETEQGNKTAEVSSEK